MVKTKAKEKTKTKATTKATKATKPKNHLVQFRVDHELYSKWREDAKSMGIPVSNWARIGLVNFFQSRHPD